MLMRIGSGVLLLALAGCASHEAHQVQAWAAGRNLAELEQCAGKPDRTDALPDGSSIAQWDYTEPNATDTASLPAQAIGAALTAAAAPIALPISLVSTANPTIGMPASGSCHAIATVRGGVVTQLRYSGPNGGMSGPDAVCAPIMRECLP